MSVQAAADLSAAHPPSIFRGDYVHCGLFARQHPRSKRMPTVSQQLVTKPAPSSDVSLACILLGKESETWQLSDETDRMLQWRSWRLLWCFCLLPRCLARRSPSPRARPCRPWLSLTRESDRTCCLARGWFHSPAPTYTGDLTSSVYNNDPSNPFGANGLTFTYLLHNNTSRRMSCIASRFRASPHLAPM